MHSSRLILKVICVSLYLVAVMKLSTACRNQTAVSFRKLATCKEFVTESRICEHLFPIENFTNLPSKDYKLYLKLYVISDISANFVLSSNRDALGKDFYWIVIGGWGNMKSMIENKARNVVVRSDTPNILSPKWVIPIIIRQKHDGELQVVIPYLAEPILTVNATDLNVQSVCLLAWERENRWFYDCNEDELTQQLNTSCRQCACACDGSTIKLTIS